MRSSSLDATPGSFLQSIVVDPATNNLGLIVTNAAEATVGM